VIAEMRINKRQEVMTTFALAEIQRLRKKASELARPQRNCPKGWSISRVDPMAVVAVFQPLRIKAGYILRAYQYCSGDNGNGFVWAMPEAAKFSEPNACPRLEEAFLEPPKPPDALDDFMNALDGDGSPWSYLCASLLCRELGDFGAMWHGCNWSTHTILGENPWKKETTIRESSVDMPSGSAADWKWLAPEPSEWRPQVYEEGDEVTVTFFTFSGLGREAIHQFNDRFLRGSYTFESERKEIATGPGGYVF
jgi:hypothetical protein